MNHGVRRMDEIFKRRQLRVRGMIQIALMTHAAKVYLGSGKLRTDDRVIQWLPPSRNLWNGRIQILPTANIYGNLRLLVDCSRID